MQIRGRKSRNDQIDLHKRQSKNVMRYTSTGKFSKLLSEKIHLNFFGEKTKYKKLCQYKELIKKKYILENAHLR